MESDPRLRTLVEAGRVGPLRKQIRQFAPLQFRVDSGYPYCREMASPYDAAWTQDFLSLALLIGGAFAADGGAMKQVLFLTLAFRAIGASAGFGVCVLRPSSGLL